MLAIRAALKTVKRTEPVKMFKRIHRKAFSDKYLLFTNVSISMGLSSAGDAIEQQFEKLSSEISEWDKQRTCNMGLSGLTVGPVCHYWYKLLDRQLPGRCVYTVVKKVVADQVICSPIYISVFFVTLGILENRTCQEILQEMKNKAWKLYAAEWAVWPAAQFINFHWVPLKYRVFYDSVISLGYDVYTSKVVNSAS